MRALESLKNLHANVETFGPVDFENCIADLERMEDERKDGGPHRLCDTFRHAGTDTLSKIDHHWSDVLDIDEVFDDLLKILFIVWSQKHVYCIKSLIYYIEIEARS